MALFAGKEDSKRFVLENPDADSARESSPVITISTSDGLPTTRPFTQSQRLPHHSFQAFGASPTPSNSIAKLQRSPTRELNAIFLSHVGATSPVLLALTYCFETSSQILFAGILHLYLKRYRNL
jgi:hypothetical protein